VGDGPQTRIIIERGDTQDELVLTAPFSDEMCSALAAEVSELLG